MSSSPPSWVSSCCSVLLAGLSLASAIDPSGSSTPAYPPKGLEYFDIRDYGAVSSHETLSTSAIAKAVSAASAAGGGIVLVDDGPYLSGQILLLSRVYLEVTSNASLFASIEPEDYPAGWVFILAENQSFTGITGAGIIDGQGTPNYIQYYQRDNDRLEPPPSSFRPRLVQFVGCDNVLVRDITLQNSPAWTSHYYKSSEILVDNITVHGWHRWPNNDGMDLDCSSNITVRHSFIDVGDDGVCLKTSAPLPLTNLLLHDLTIRSRSGAVKIGSSTRGDMAHILVANITVLGGTNRALGIQHRDQGSISDLEYRNVTVLGTGYNPWGWWGAGEAIWVTSIKREASQPSIGRISDLRFVQVHGLTRNAVLLSSRSGKPIEQLLLQSVRLHLVPPLPRVSGFNYTRCGTRDYRPTTVAPNSFVPVKAPFVYFEGVADANVTQSSFVFDSSSVLSAVSTPAPSWWGSTCLAGDASSTWDATSVVCQPPPDAKH